MKKPRLPVFIRWWGALASLAQIYLVVVAFSYPTFECALFGCPSGNENLLGMVSSDLLVFEATFIMPLLVAFIWQGRSANSN